MARQKFKRLNADPQVFVCDETGAVACFHVDDVLLICLAKSLQKVQERINKEFKMKWLSKIQEGQSTKYLGKE